MLTWKEKTVIRILLLIANMLCEQDAIKLEIRSLANHISVRAKETSHD